LHVEPAAQLLVPTHAPCEQTSVVQATPSLHDAVLFGCVQAPPLHTSLVHGLLSVAQAAVLLACVHPVAGAQLSFVQALLSLQFGAAPPTQVPF
jgi:hypothetical protein